MSQFVSQKSGSVSILNVSNSPGLKRFESPAPAGKTLQRKPRRGAKPNYGLFVDRRISRGLDKRNSMEAVRFRTVAFSLRNDFIIRRLQVPIP